jgi:hypothetical protein
MRPLKSLTFDQVIKELRGTFEQVPDERAIDQVLYPMADTLMSGFAMLFFQHPSLLNFQRVMEKKKQDCNLKTIFKVKAVPSDTQMRTILDGAPPEPLRAVLPDWFGQIRRAGWAGQFRIGVPTQAGTKVRYTKTEEYYTLAIDGSEYFHSTAIQCPACLRKTTAQGPTQYSHVVVGASLVKAGTHTILPLDAEEVRNTDGHDKQDCEINAGKRLLRRVRREHRQMKIIVTGDDLYAHEPFVDELTDELHMHYVLVAKPDSHKELFKWVADFEREGLSWHGTWEEGPAGQRHFFEYRIVRQVPLSGSLRRWVTFVEVWERDRHGKLLYHNSWVTDLEVDADNVAIIIAIGRSRWKIENEQFNVHKNHGYELEHNYGHGQKSLSMVFYLLNLLAFVAHILLDLGDWLYKQCRAQQSRRELWNILRTAMHLVLVDSWQGLLRAYLDDDVARAP